jgi:hypothetical protein
VQARLDLGHLVEQFGLPGWPGRGVLAAVHRSSVTAGR